MYQIIVGGNVVALCDKPRFIKVNEKSGAYIEATEKDAQGVSADGVAYNLVGHDEIKTIIVNEETSATETVDADVAILKEVDGGFVTFQNNVRINGNEVKINEVDETALTGLMATTDLYEELIKKGVLD
ncbi:MAG: hypothetical protein J6I62_10065 [Selenomonadaceae bacterium]|nr:hypothetical protein [Selenomonadaceae bacterium]